MKTNNSRAAGSDAAKQIKLARAAYDRLAFLNNKTWTKVNMLVKSYGHWALGFSWVTVTLGGYPMAGLALYASHRANEPIRRVVGSIKEAMTWFQSNRIPARAAGKFLAHAMAHELAPASWQPRTQKNYLIEHKQNGLIYASGLADSARDARVKTGLTGRDYRVIEATADGIKYLPIKRVRGCN